MGTEQSKSEVGGNPPRDYGELPAPLPPRVDNGLRGVRVWDRARAWPGYTLFSPAFGYTEYLIDMNGRVVHTWPVVRSQWAELDSDGSLFWDNFTDWNEDRDRCFGGLFESDFEGNVTWAWYGRVHHDFHRFDDGTLLTLYQRDRDRPDIFPRGPVEDDLIMKVDRKTFVHWEWWLSDHVDELVDLAGLELPRPAADWSHTNTLTVLPDTPVGRADKRFRAGNYLLSHRCIDIISVVDSDSREIVWAWGIGVLEAASASDAPQWQYPALRQRHSTRIFQGLGIRPPRAGRLPLGIQRPRRLLQPV